MRTGGYRLTAFAAAALAFGAAFVMGTPGPAWAVQTSTWGIVAAPNSPTKDYRPEIVYPASGRTVTDSVIVWNRTASPLTVHLAVLSVSDPSGTYQYSTQVTGLAAGVHLPTDQVSLGPYQQAMVPVRIDEPAGLTQPEMAAVAGESRAVKDGALSVQEQLAVLIKATPTDDVVGTGHPSNGTSGPVVFLGTVGAAFIGFILLLVERERRRQDEEVVAEAVGKAPITLEFLAALPPPLVLVGAIGAREQQE